MPQQRRTAIVEAEHPPISTWKHAAAIIWVLFFLAVFYSMPLPNNGNYPRSEFWLFDVPIILTDPIAHGPDTGWRFLPQRVDLVATAAFILAAAWGWGGVCIRILRLETILTRTERLVFSFGLGLSALSLFTLGCGLAGWLNRPLLGSIAALGIIAGAVTSVINRRRMTSPPNELSQREEASPILRAACIAAIAPFIWIMLLGAMLPSTDFDVKEYHIQGPKEYFQNGRVSFLPHNVYTSFPFLTEMLSLLAMVLRNDWFRGALAGQVVLMSFAPITGLALYAAGKRWFSESAGWLAAMIFLTTPWTYRISTIAYAEGGLSFFLFAATFATGLALQCFVRGELRWPLFLLAGLLSGSAMACKYPGVVSVVIPLAAAIVLVSLFARYPESQNLSRGERIKFAIQATLLFSVGVAITIGPWLLKNLFETGNPVYPLLYSVFGGTDWDAAMNAKWRAGHSPDDYNFTNISTWILDVTAKNDWLSALLYAFAPLAFLIPRADRAHHSGARSASKGLWILTIYLFLTWWLLTHRLDRFWVPMIPVVALLAGAGATWSNSALWKFFVTVIIAACVIFNLTFASSVASGYNAYLFDLDKARTAASELTNPGIEYVNNLNRDGVKVLCVGEAQVFDATFPLVYNTVFDRSIFQEWTADAQPNVLDADQPLRSADEIRRKLSEQGITHVLVNWQEILRYRTSYGYTPYVTPERFQSLVNKGVLQPPIVIRYSDAKQFSAEQQQELENWGRALRSGDDNSVFTAIELYPVK